MLQENCSAGCPCSEFECKSPPPEPTPPSGPANAVLVLNNLNSGKKPMIVDFSGNINDDLTFRYGWGTVASGGCGTTLKNEFWYFGGGNPYSQQVWFQFELDRFIILGEQNHWMQVGASGGFELWHVPRCMQHFQSARAKSFTLLWLLLQSTMPHVSIFELLNDFWSNFQVSTENSINQLVLLFILIRIRIE